MYPPRVFLNGVDIGFWSSASALPRALDATQRQMPVVDLSLAWRRQSEASLQLNLNVAPRDTLPPRPKNTPLEWVAYVAVVEQNLSSNVSAGENANVVLQHAHTVRQLIGPIALTLTPNATGGEIRELLKIDPRWKQPDLSPVAFVQHRITGEQLQAISVRLCATG